MERIPIVDISPFTSDGNEASKQRAAADLAEKGRVNGCVGMKGHGISAAKLDQAFAISKKLFDLPYEDKMKAPHPDGNFPHRGYSWQGRENASLKSALETDDKAEKERLLKIKDIKETYEVGSEENKANYNIWLPEDVLPGFREFALEFFRELNVLSDAVLEALIMSIGLSEEEAQTLRALHTGYDNQLRWAHYPPAKGDASEVSRLGAHTDFSTFTLLFQDSNGGLEFEDRRTGKFIAATPKDGVLYMNIGDMFQRMSNGFYPSAKHRVVVSDGRDGGDGEQVGSRYSLPHFISPAVNGVIEPQPSCVARDGKQLYDSVTFSSLAQRILNAVNTLA